jgi:hypothetical protein
MSWPRELQSKCDIHPQNAMPARDCPDSCYTGGHVSAIGMVIEPPRCRCGTCPGCTCPCHHTTVQVFWPRGPIDEAARKIADAVDRGANATQVGGTHYVKHGDFQPWDAWWHWKLNAFQGAIIKYVVRYRDKGGVEDLKKARHYLDKLIECEEQARATATGAACEKT